MTDQEKFAQLQHQINRLLEQQHRLTLDIRTLQNELDEFHAASLDETKPLVTPAPTVPAPPAPRQPVLESKVADFQPVVTQEQNHGKETVDWEQYVGGNLISKVGIVILLIGLGLFVKYAIDKGWFPAPVRVALGYLAGLTLVVLAYRFRDKYRSYSAVLFSGGMATLYFTSYLGWTFFNPPVLALLVAFWLMVVFTVVTVSVAGYYNQQIIGLLGLVGAYAVPFLVHTGSGNYPVLFLYMSIINLGVLLLAAWKVWKPMTYTATLLTWFILAVAFLQDYSKLNDSVATWAFSIISFQIFYAALLADQIWNPTRLGVVNLIMIILNALFFYLFCTMLTEETFGDGAFGLATLIMAVVHFVAGYLLWVKIDNKNPAFALFMLALFFLTIAIPIQFEIKTSVLLWIVLGLGLLYLSGQPKFSLFETPSRMVAGLAALSWLGTVTNRHWDTGYENIAFVNIDFLINLLATGGLMFYAWLNRRLPRETFNANLRNLISIVPAVMLYITFFTEISFWFQQKLEHPGGIPGTAYSIEIFRNASLLLYSLVFVTALALVNQRWWKNERTEAFTAMAGLGLVVLFFIFEMNELNELRGLYLGGEAGSNWFFIGIRYVCYAFMAGAFWVAFQALNRLEEIPETAHKYLALLPHLFLLTVLSFELINVWLLNLGVAESALPYRLGLSILWGLYSLLLIGLGIFKKSQVLRIAGIVLFSVTLVKIFFFDLVSLSILSRTILFLALGVLLLLTSYLYQRYKEQL